MPMIFQSAESNAPIVSLRSRSSRFTPGRPCKLTWLAVLYGLFVAIAVFDRLPVPLLPLSLYRVLSAPLLFVLLLSVLGQNRVRIHVSTHAGVTLAAFLLWAGVSALASPEKATAAIHLLRYGEYVAIALVLALALGQIWQQTRWIPLCWTLMAAAVLSAGTILSDSLGFTHLFSLYTAERPYVRHMGILGEANYGAGKLCILLPFLFFLAERCGRNHHWGRLTLVAGGCLAILAAVFVTGSRMGGAIAVGMLAVFLLRLARLSKCFRRILVCGSLLASIGLAVATPHFDRFGTTAHYVIGRYRVLVSLIQTGREEYGAIHETAIHERLDVLAAGVQMVIDRPLVGVGPGAFSQVIGSYDVRYTSVYSHNTYVSMIVELGLPGLLLFACLCLSVFRSTRRQRWTQGTSGETFSVYLRLSCIAQLLVFLFLHDADSKLFWTLFVPLSLWAGSRARTQGSS